MLFARIKRTDPEKVYVVVKNSYATASLTNGQAVMWDYETDADGVGVTKPSASVVGKSNHIAGIVAETIAAGAYGLVQVYGHHTAILVRTTTAAGCKIAVGTGLRAPLAAAFCLESPPISGTQASVGYCGIAGAAQSLWTSSAIAGFVKSLG